VPQLLEAIAELQAKGYKVPNYNQTPGTPEEAEIKKRYGAVLGSAVNPVLREGNSDRRCAPPVKEQAKKQTKRSPGVKPWNKENKTCVAHMTEGDFYGSEQSYIMQNNGAVQIVLKKGDGATRVLKEDVKLEAAEVIDATCLSKAKLCQFFEKEIEDSNQRNLMMSLHMKATMMKVSDPIIFGHCVKVYFKDVFSKHGDVLASMGLNPNNGLGDVYDKLKNKNCATSQDIVADIEATYKTRPGL
jgi:isocitrate dehydrogenase